MARLLNISADEVCWHILGSFKCAQADDPIIEDGKDDDDDDEDEDEDDDVLDGEDGQGEGTH